VKHRPLFCLVALAVFHPFVSAQSSCDKPFVVSQVTLPSTTHLSGSEQAAIRARLIGRCIDDQKLTELTGVVQDELQSLGYFRATVTEPAVIASDGSRHPQPVTLKVDLQEGARYKVGEIEWWNSKVFSGDQLVSLSPIQLEEVLDLSKVRSTVEAVHSLYAANGYPKASIVPQFRFDETRHRVVVIFDITEGGQMP
jgi:hypothetical protein